MPEVQRQQPGGIPSHLRVAKVYYKPHVQDILEEHDEIQGFGDGAAAEWQKGLATKGKDKMTEAARWERWEQQLHNRADLARVLREYDLASFPRHLEAAQGRSAARVSNAQPLTHTNGKLARFCFTSISILSSRHLRFLCAAALGSLKHPSLALFVV